MNDHYVTRGEIILMLKKWQCGEVGTQQLWDWASHRYQAGGADYDDWEDSASVAHEVLGALDSLDMHCMLVEDVPLYLAFLETPIGAFEEGYRDWQQAQNAIDYPSRRQRLKDDPIYALYC
jgi:hypothetical protein